MTYVFITVGKERERDVCVGGRWVLTRVEAPRGRGGRGEGGVVGSQATGLIHFLFHCPKYSIPREKFYNQIQQNFVDFNQLSYTELIIKLMNSQNFSVNSHLLKFVSLCNDLRNNLLSNHADDT